MKSDIPHLILTAVFISNFREIPVIFLTALNETADTARGFSLGGVDYVTKPFQFVDVRARVQTHLELSRQKRPFSNDQYRQPCFDGQYPPGDSRAARLSGGR